MATVGIISLLIVSCIHVTTYRYAGISVHNIRRVVWNTNSTLGCNTNSNRIQNPCIKNLPGLIPRSQSIVFQQTPLQLCTQCVSLIKESVRRCPYNSLPVKIDHYHSIIIPLKKKLYLSTAQERLNRNGGIR